MILIKSIRNAKYLFHSFTNNPCGKELKEHLLFHCTSKIIWNKPQPKKWNIICGCERKKFLAGVKYFSIKSSKSYFHIFIISIHILSFHTHIHPIHVHFHIIIVFSLFIIVVKILKICENYLTPIFFSRCTLFLVEI